MGALYLRTVALKGTARSFRFDRVRVRLKKSGGVEGGGRSPPAGGGRGGAEPPPSCCRTLKPLKPPFKPFYAQVSNRA